MTEPVAVSQADINELIDTFDFLRVHYFMAEHRWYWHGRNTAPNITELEKAARELIDLVVTDKCRDASSRGFMVLRKDNSIILKFIFEVESAEC